jgi:hypothetical protein
MQRGATAGAGHVIDIEPHILARQMIRQRPASRRRFEFVHHDRRSAFPDATDIAVDIFWSERELSSSLPLARVSSS